MEPNIEKLMRSNAVNEAKEAMANMKLHEDDEPVKAIEQNWNAAIFKLPDELLMMVLKKLIVVDVYSVEMFAQSCKSFYVFARDSQLWKIAFQYWHTKAFPASLSSLPSPPADSAAKSFHAAGDFAVITSPYRQLFLETPRLRIDGLYICRCSYMRSGHTEFSFSQPVHIVNYYRYFRFFKNGKCLSLLTFLEPVEAIPLLKQFKGNALLSQIDIRQHSSNSAHDKNLTRLMEGYYTLNDNDRTVHCVVSSNHRPNTVFHFLFTLKCSVVGSWNKIQWKEYYSIKNDAETTVYETRDFKNYWFSRVKRYI
jgi:F-box protein 9